MPGTLRESTSVLRSLPKTHQNVLVLERNDLADLTKYFHGNFQLAPIVQSFQFCTHISAYLGSSGPIGALHMLDAVLSRGHRYLPVALTSFYSLDEVEERGHFELSGESLNAARRLAVYPPSGSKENGNPTSGANVLPRRMFIDG
jgi:hypothetical protein